MSYETLEVTRMPGVVTLSELVARGELLARYDDDDAVGGMFA